MTGAAALISLDEFIARLERLGAPARYAVAVSGGRDSMALARLSALHAETGAVVVALIVDHDLRADSAREAAAAAAWCEAAGLKTRILKWVGPKPATAIQEAARAARYKLLLDAAAGVQLPAIITAHTSDDQAETVFMRLARGAGPRGLAGMSASSLIASGAGDPLSLLRPFLDFSRARTEATVAAFRQEYVDDPSNDDPKFERVTTRALLAALEEQAILRREDLIRTAQRCAETREAMDAAASAAFASAGGCFHRWGYATFCAPPNRIGADCLGRLLRSISGADHQPNESEVSAFAAMLEGAGAATLGGAIGRRHQGLYFISREPSSVLGRAGVPPIQPLKLEPGKRVLWDRRFAIENGGSEPVSVMPMGSDPDVARRASALLDAPADAVAAIPFAPTLGLLDQSPLVVRALANEAFARRVTRYH
jgi:tRNA(Ile)-lysidine synthase